LILLLLLLFSPMCLDDAVSRHLGAADEEEQEFFFLPL
jgi:hypothetical protein